MLDSRGVQTDNLTNLKTRGFGFEIVVMILPLLTQLEILSHDIVGFAKCAAHRSDELIASDAAGYVAAVRHTEWDGHLPSEV